MTPRLTELWVYLSASPLLGLTLTLVAYQAAFWLYKRAGYHPLANPVMLAITMVATVLALSGMDYGAYFDGAQFVHFLLGPATVALAIPLYAQWPRLKAMAGPLMIALAVREMGMTPAEALLGATVVAAKTLRRNNIGKVAVGMRADLAAAAAASWLHIPYRVGVPIVRALEV